MFNRRPPWKTAPFIRLVIPLMLGIILQWYVQFNVVFIIFTACSFIVSFVLLRFFSFAFLYKLRWLQGFILQLIIFAFALLLTWRNDIRHQQDWYGHIYKNSSAVVLVLSEPLEEKEKSFKAIANVVAIINDRNYIPVSGKLIIYFAKDSLPVALNYGDRILIKKSLQLINNSSNPGGFDYRRYCAFQQIFQTVYLKANEYTVLNQRDVNWFNAFIFRSRAFIVQQLHLLLPGDKEITGIAEALLIGYKADLDKDLVQAYSNTGVVHIIAISGLHLGLIYCLLAWVFNRLPGFKSNALLRVSLILGCLWLFAILTGSSASVLRSAVMFTCILLGNTWFKRSSVYNALAASAFMLLCYDPYFLWDVGFQLSYLAVIGIVWLQQPLHRSLYIKNKWVDKIWSMCTVTVAAQLLAFPICLFYFHQFPNLFLLTNLVAVPLSTLILFAEIFLLVFSWLPIVAVYTGKLVSFLIGLMNEFISWCNNVPYASVNGIFADIFSTWLLYAVVAGVASWFLHRQKWMGRIAISCSLCFLLWLVFLKIIGSRQAAIIVYNIPKASAIDIVLKTKCLYIGDSITPKINNLYLKPSRTGYQVSETKTIAGIATGKNTWLIHNKRIMWICEKVKFEPLAEPLSIDILIISRQPDVLIADLVKAVKPAVIVFDASNSLWKIAKWKKECSLLLLPFHSVPEQGAFVYNIK